MAAHQRRLAVIGALTATMMMASAGTAFAHVCINASKPVGAGSAGTATIEVTDEDPHLVPDDVNLNPQGRLRGGFITITVKANGETIDTVDTFAHTTLPEGARNAGPGDDMCDGIGIDDAEACLAP